MSHGIAGGMSTFSRMPIGGMAMDVGMSANGQNLESNTHLRPTEPSMAANPKKKRRTNAKVARSAVSQFSKVQKLGPPLLTGYGDTVVVSNPFDDNPSRMSLNSQNIHHNRIGCPPTRPMSIMSPMMNIMGPMMPQNVRNMPPMSVNHMGPISSANNGPMIRMSPMSNIPQNFQNGPIMNDPMKMGLMGNHEMGGPHMGNMINNISLNHQMTKIPLNNQMNNISLNNQMSNGPINPNNINGHAPTNNPMNGMNNIAQHVPNPSQFHPNHTSNDIGNVGQLMNANMHISHENHMGLVEDSMGQMPSNRAPSVRENMNLPDTFSHSGLNKRPLEMPKAQSYVKPWSRKHSNEKIYPADQPIIFDSQNLNAPPIYPCGICHKEVNDHDRGVVCESGCNFWFHRVCLGLSEAAFQLLSREVYAEWVCDNCLRSKDIPMVKFKP